MIMGMSFLIAEAKPLKLELDINYDAGAIKNVSLTMGTGFTRYGESSVNLEMPGINLEELVKRLQEVQLKVEEHKKAL